MPARAGQKDEQTVVTRPSIATTDWVTRFDDLQAIGDPSGSELDELGLAAWFLGRHDECERAWDAAQRAYLADDDRDAAIRCVFWLGYTLDQRGNAVKSRAWMGRLLELCHDSAPGGSAEAAAVAATCEAVAAWASGRMESSVEMGEQAVALARTAGDADVEVLATMLLGRSLVRLGRLDEGFSCMDAVMLAISSGAVSDRAAGPAYCAVIASCLERWDIERARVWTRDLSDWCDAQRGLEPFRGECSVHRATVLGITGEWEEASAVLTEVAQRERRPETLENALYRLGELHRLAGRTDAAEAAFRQAAGLGREVQPGLGRLRWNTRQASAARSGVARALAAGPLPGIRADLLAAQADFEAAGGDLEIARRASDELRGLAEAFGTVYLAALADRADGTVLLAAGEPERALPLLRRAWLGWRALEDPYNAALTRILLGSAARAMSDEEAAELEFDAARTALSGLGAIPDLARLERVAASGPPAATSAGLSRRELDVIRLIAAGASNRDIAIRLFLSERTVARHVSNILAKLGLGNRSSATAYAFEHGLVVAH